MSHSQTLAAVILLYAVAIILLAGALAGLLQRRVIKRRGITREPVRSHGLVGATILAFRADGCMAHVHTFLWAGTVFRVEPSAMKNVPVGRYHDAIVKVHKSGDLGMDSRDGPFPVKRVIVEDSALQRLAPGLYQWVH